jgi:transcriptional regulator with XRE-family HTH domain
MAASRLMPTRERPADRGRRKCRDAARGVARDARRARIGAGLSLRAVGAATGIDRGRIWRFERGRFGLLRVEDVGAICAAVGLDLAFRAYPAGDPIRDAGQARLLALLRARLHPSLRWRTEVPLPISGDLRAWDAMVRGPRWRIAVEAETVLDDIQALERRLALKRRDGDVDHVILLVADTTRNRRAIASAPAALADLQLRTRHVLAALSDGRDPSASGIVIL